MTTIIIYGVCLIIIVLIYIKTSGYKKQEWEDLNKKEHTLKILYGMSMFIVDKVLRKWLMRPHTKIDNQLKELYVKDKVKTERYIYVATKVSICIAVMIGSVIIGIILETKAMFTENELTVLERTNYGEGETKYCINVYSEDESKSVSLTVDERTYSNDELLKILDIAFEELKVVMLGENKSVNIVNSQLNLVNAIGEYNISVLWSIDNTDIIDYEGILGKNIPKEGIITDITATLSIQNVSKNYTISMNVFPNKEKPDLQSILQDTINNYDLSKKQIHLPTKINGKAVMYKNGEDDVGQYILIAGIILAIVMYFAKDRDLNKKIKDRKAQMVIDYPEIVSKIMLLFRAGMSVRRAWERTVLSVSEQKKNNYAYKEMRLALAKMNSGVSEVSAINEFGKRCGIHCYIKFSNLIVQNVKRGTGELGGALEQEAEEAMIERGNQAIKAGEEAGTKLLLPMVIMLIIGMAIIIAPAFMSLKSN